MIKRIKKKYTKDQVLGKLDPLIKDWFNQHFEDVTAAQAYAIPVIQRGENVLVSSPTGSGKTLTAFLMILNELFKLGKNDTLENKVYCVYISPLKALANDIERNLNLPLDQIYKMAEEYGITLPEIRVGVRTGDTSASERQKMLRKAPHILITTPESLSLIVSTKRFSSKLHDTRFLIVDEIHEICNSKRGVHLSLTVERLSHQVVNTNDGSEFVRIGLSATQAPIREIAKFLVGYDQDQNLRDINIVEVPATKELDLKIICPVPDMNISPFEIVNNKMYDIIVDLIRSHRTSLIFTNTRSGAETVVYRLKERGLENIAAHHGSLSKETRQDVEQKLKNGTLSATVCSTSLELGIDIGYIDLVCQLGSPKSIAKGLQRIGRAGHALHKISKGRFIIFDRDDLVECAVLVKNAYAGNIDRVNILQNCLDVLAQCLVGMSLVQAWDIDEAYRLVKQSYCYHKLLKRDFLSVLKYLAGNQVMEERGIYGKIRTYTSEHTFGIRRGARTIYYLNIGTIPQEANYRVMLKGTGSTIGVLSEKFIERLTKKDVFVLGGKSYEYIQTKHMKIFVQSAKGKKPTIPSWTGEMLPRTFDLSVEVGKFRAEVSRRLDLAFHKQTEQSGKSSAITSKLEAKLVQIENWLKAEYYLDTGSARSIINYFIEQRGIIKELPNDKKLLIEGYIDGRGFRNIIFHFCFGRRINETLARAYAYALSKKQNCTVRFSVTDNNFILSVSKHIDLSGIERIVSIESLRECLELAIRNTELFKQRFRHCAVRSLMILRNYKGVEIPVRRQMKRSTQILDRSDDLPHFPVLNETYHEIMYESLDLVQAKNVLERLGSGEITVYNSGYSKIPSPFAHNGVLSGISDIILMEDRSSLLCELHQQVLNKVFSTLELPKPKFEPEVIQKHFQEKFPFVSKQSDISELLSQVGPLHLFKERGKSIYSHLTPNTSHQTVQKWSQQLISNKDLISIPINNDIYWLPEKHLKYYERIYSDPNDIKLDDTDEQIIYWLSSVDPNNRGIPVTKKCAPQNIGISQKELKSRLKRLEKKLLVHRLAGGMDGNIRWYLNIDRFENLQPDKPLKIISKDNIDIFCALEFLILQQINYYAPISVSELVFNLGLGSDSRGVNKELVNKILIDLEESGRIVAGNFIWGKELPQYLLAMDATILAKPPTKKQKVFDGAIVQEFSMRKNFDSVKNINEYFEKYRIAFSPREVFLRTSDFTVEKWSSALSGTDITGGRRLVFGRLLGGRLCYIPETDLNIYASAYRETSLNDQELMVLKIIKSQRGITRQEIAKKLDAREIDLKEIIEKLERNIYIIREPPKYDSQIGVSRYQVYEQKNDKRVSNSKQLIVQQLIHNYAPLSEIELKNYTGFSSESINSILKSFLASGALEEITVLQTGGNEVQMYLPKKEFFSLKKAEKVTSPIKSNVKIVSMTDNYSIRSVTEIRTKFGDGWYSPIIYMGELIGVIELWRLTDCVEIRDITIDYDLFFELIKYQNRAGSMHNNKPDQNDLWRAELLKEILEELDNLMGFYKIQNLDVIRLRAIFGCEVESLPTVLKSVVTELGYKKIQSFFAKGQLHSNFFGFKQIMRIILQNQHILPQYKFNNPLDIIRKMGGIRSNYELRLRLNGQFYDIKEFRKNLGLAAGSIIPEYFGYCTEKDLQIYKTAKGRRLDFNMEFILENMPDKYPISSKNLFARLTLPQKQYITARKRLYNGLFITRDPMNRFVKVLNYRYLSKDDARKFVLKRIISNFGIFSIEGLSSFVKHEYSRSELREMLLKLENEGFLVKGYFLKDDETLYWMSNESLKILEKGNLDFTFNERFIISPQDQLSTYLAPIVREKFGFSSCFIIFHGLEPSGVFIAKLKNKYVKVLDFKGDEDDWKAVEKFFRVNKIELIDEAAEELYTDYDDEY